MKIQHLGTAAEVARMLFISISMLFVNESYDGILSMDLPAEHQIKGKQTSAIIAPIFAEPTPAMTILVSTIEGKISRRAQ